MTTTERINPRDKIAVSIDEAAQLLSVSRSYFYNWAMPAVRTGRIRSLRVGRNVRIFVDSLMSWAADQAEPAA